MKKKIHPISKKVDVICSCGNMFSVIMVIDTNILNIDICSKCHPFYTGKQKLVDTAGKIDSYNRRFLRKDI